MVMAWYPEDDDVRRQRRQAGRDLLMNCLPLVVLDSWELLWLAFVLLKAPHACPHLGWCSSLTAGRSSDSANAR